MKLISSNSSTDSMYNLKYMPYLKYVTHFGVVLSKTRRPLFTLSNGGGSM
jgi:hypothetical protein